MPTGNYELEFTFSRVHGSQDLCVLFPAGATGTTLARFLYRPIQLSRRTTKAKARDDLVRIINEKPQQVHMTVEATDQQATIEVQLNGVKYLSWSGKITDLKVNPTGNTRRSHDWLGGIQNDQRGIQRITRARPDWHHRALCPRQVTTRRPAHPNFATFTSCNPLPPHPRHTRAESRGLSVDDGRGRMSEAGRYWR